MKTVSTLQVTTGPSRRRTPRILVDQDLWVYWESHSYRDVSRVRDLSPTGLFLETHSRRREGELVTLHFLVQEGRIRADAVVRHVAPGRGFGMKINSISTQDAPQLQKLIVRLQEKPFLPKPPQGGSLSSARAQANF